MPAIREDWGGIVDSHCCGTEPIQEMGELDDCLGLACLCPASGMSAKKDALCPPMTDGSLVCAALLPQQITATCRTDIDLPTRFLLL